MGLVSLPPHLSFVDRPLPCDYGSDGPQWDVRAGNSPSLYVIRNSWYEDWPDVRVDLIPDDMKERGSWKSNATDPNPSTGKVGEWDTTIKSQIYENLNNEGQTIDYQNARAVLSREGLDVANDYDFQRSLNGNGFEILHSYGQYVKYQLHSLWRSSYRQMVNANEVSCSQRTCRSISVKYKGL